MRPYVAGFKHPMTQYRKIDEIPFDFVRRRMSVVVEDKAGLNTLICKGAVEEVLTLCTRVEVKGEVIEVLPEHDAKRRKFKGGQSERAGLPSNCPGL